MSRVSRTDYSGKGFNQLQKVLDDLYTRNKKSQARIAYESIRINDLEIQMKGIQDDLARMHNALKSRVEALENKK